MTYLNSKKIYPALDELNNKFDAIRRSSYPEVSSRPKTTSGKAIPLKPSVRIQVGGVPTFEKTGYRAWGVSVTTGIVVLGALGLKYGLNQTEPAPAPLPAPPEMATATPVSLTQTNTASTEPVDPFTKGQAIAEHALEWSNSAASVDDWALTTRKLEAAIRVLGTIPASSPKYNAAQARIVELRAELAIARRNVNQTIPRDAGLAIASVSATANVVGSVTCQPVATAPDSVPVEIHNVEFQGSQDDSGADYLVGCITNHTGQTITQLSLIYKATSSDAPDIFRTGREDIIPVEVRPGQTVSFRSSFTINPSFQTVEIQAISWMPPDAEEAQITATNVQLSR